MGIKIECEAKINGKCEKSLCCDCADAQCYLDCSGQCLGVLAKLDAALADAYFGLPEAPKAAKGNCLHLSYKAVCGETGTVLVKTESKSEHASDDLVSVAKEAFECCRQHPAVTKCLVP